MMGRWRNQTDPGRRVADLGDPGIDLAAGQFSALTGLGALGHLDLQLLRLGQIITGHAKAP